MFQGLGVNLDCGYDKDSGNHLLLMSRSPFFVKTLSASHLLGLSGPTSRTVPSKAAWILLHLKAMTQLMTTVQRMHAQQNGGSLDKTFLQPGFVAQFVGVTRWLMSFMVYLIDSLITLGLRVREMSQRDPNVKASSLTRTQLESLIAEQNSPALTILLSAFPRAMIRLWGSPLNFINGSAQKMTTTAPNMDLRRIYSPLSRALESTGGLSFRKFEAIINEVHHKVVTCYRQAGMNEAARNRVEREVLSGNIPDVLLPVARNLVGEYLWGTANADGAIKTEAAVGAGPGQTSHPEQSKCLSERIEVSKIMFYNTDWLGFNDTKAAREWHRTHIVDIVEKTVIRGTGAQLPSGMPASASRNNISAAKEANVAQVGGGGGGGALGLGITQDATLASKKDKLRRCVRCGAYMEDVVPGTPGYANQHVTWLINVAKHCVCGSAWSLVENPLVER
jgi:mediator of RNA polymerase II transcription subunit 16